METLKVTRDGITLDLTYNSPNIIADIKKSDGKFYEIGMLDAISKLPYRRGIAMDIGANTGNHTVFFSRFCNFDEVWAYEPNKATFALLKHNVNKHCKRTVRLYNCAVGDRKGKVAFTDNIDNPAVNKVTRGKGDTTIIPITTVVTIRLIKIDVEGYEAKVLKGASAVIERDKPELFVECHGDPDGLLKLLPEGYKIVKRYNNSPTYHLSYYNR